MSGQAKSAAIPEVFAGLKAAQGHLVHRLGPWLSAHPRLMPWDRWLGVLPGATNPSSTTPTTTGGTSHHKAPAFGATGALGPGHSHTG